ncbi:MAG: aminotransferase class I/II-fold pyridoxal phosphate-dependent enzyme [Clostridia bacterium]|nr:aminotransferase class I/II-fold pyridoxal phosphate-dependent enzyme [Clostridia bacterium]
MELRPFELERYFSRYEFSVSHLLSSSDCEPLSLDEILSLADSNEKSLWDNLKLSYTESGGHPLLVEAIANLYSNSNTSDILEIIPEEGIYIAMRTLIKKGDHVVVMHPCYQSLEEIAVSQGAEVKRWHASYDDKWRFDIEDLRNLCNSSTEMVIINTPHNPTGAHFSHAEFMEIVNICRANNSILFCDEMYRFLEYHSDARLPSACEIYENSVCLGGLSKSFALPGLRCGWLITKNKDFMQRFRTYKDYTTICAAAPAEILSIIALKNRDKIINRNLNIIYHNLAHLDNFARKYKSIINYSRPVAGSICMPVLDSSLDSAELAENLIEEKSLMVLPSKVFNIEINAFRLGFGRSDFIDNLNILDKYLEKHL